MPVLTEDELQRLQNHVIQSERNLIATQNQFEEINENFKKTKKEKHLFKALFIFCFVFFSVSIAMFLLSPHLLGVRKISMASEEVIMEKKELEAYKTTIAQLQAQLDELKVQTPLDQAEFYTVQLGAFKKFATPLTSSQFQIIHNTEYQDFKLFTLGVFETKEEAEKLLKVVKELNFKDAFVGKYKNGKRMDNNTI